MKQQLSIGIFGDGCLGLDETIRDGVTIDRRGWMRHLLKIGHNVKYYSHRTKCKDLPCVNLFEKYKLNTLEFEKCNPFLFVVTLLLIKLLYED